MVDVKNNANNKGWDLKFLYNLSQQAFEEKSFTESLKLSKMGLEVAKSRKKSKWINKFNSIFQEALKFHPDFESNESTTTDKPVTSEENEGSEEFLEEEIKPEEKSPQVYDKHTKNKRKSIKEKTKQDKTKTNEPQTRKEHQKELLNGESLETLRNTTEKTLESLGYHIIVNEKGLGKKKYKKTGVDIVSLKAFEVSNKIEICLIFLVKISPLRGVIIVGEKSVQYNPINNNFNHDNSIESKYLKPIKKCLKKSQKTIFKELIEESYFYKYLRNYLRNKFYLEKSIGRRRLFFRNNTHQYKVIVNPIIVSNSGVKFFEKSIPFAFQRKSNLRVVNVARFQELIRYLESKYFLLENNSKKKSDLEIQQEKFQNFCANLCKFSSPFFAFGIILLFVILLQSFFQLALPLDLFVNSGYMAIGILLSTIFFLYINYLRLTTKVTKRFRTPYHRLPIDFEESDLLLLEDEFDSELVRQFTYECFGKEEVSEEYTSLCEDFEEEEDDEYSDPNLSNSKKSELQNDLIKKYSSFLED